MTADWLKGRMPAAWTRWRDERWPALSRWFAARTRRERAILLLGAVSLVWGLADVLWLGQAWQQRQQAAAQRLERGLQRQMAEAEAAALAKEIQFLEDAELRQLGQARQRAAQAQQALQSGESGLVGAQQMLPLLQALLRQGCSEGATCGQSLQVLSLRTLAPVDLSTPAVAWSGTAAPPASAPQGGPVGRTAGRPGLWKHGVEIVIAGSFADLAAYVQRLEALPQRWLRGGLQFRVEQHPRATLTLRLYTLSLDPGWLEL
jgi:MSHA biogenesis protein MshJ